MPSPTRRPSPPAPQGHRTCSRCHGTGTYYWGAIHNGRPTHSGTCYHCLGKGYQDSSDIRRCDAYNRYSLRLI